MPAYFAYIKSSLLSDERAQDAFEYMLVVGGVSVAIILAIATPVGTNLITAVVDGVCAAMDTIPVISTQLVCP